MASRNCGKRDPPEDSRENPCSYQSSKSSFGCWKTIAFCRCKPRHEKTTQNMKLIQVVVAVTDA
jgi:hypothetical protein